MVSTKLINYINQRMNEGESIDQIKGKLQSNPKYSETEFNDALSEINSRNFSASTSNTANNNQQSSSSTSQNSTSQPQIPGAHKISPQMRFTFAFILLLGGLFLIIYTSIIGKLKFGILLIGLLLIIASIGVFMGAARISKLMLDIQEMKARKRGNL